MATAWQSVSLDSGGAVLISGTRAFGLVFESVAEADEFQLFAREMHGPNWSWMLPATLDQCLTLMRSLPRIACGGCGAIHRAYGQHGCCPKCDV